MGNIMGGNDNMVKDIVMEKGTTMEKGIAMGKEIIMENDIIMEKDIVMKKDVITMRGIEMHMNVTGIADEPYQWNCADMNL